MIALIRHFNGRLEGAVLLSRTRNTIRLAAPGRGDAVVYRLRDGRWVSEHGGHVEIEFSVAESEFELGTTAKIDRLALGCAIGTLAVA